MDGTILQAIVSNVYAVLIVVLFFGLSVFVHEFGHFLAAKLCGLVVDVFSIGFGPALWKKTIGSLVLRVGIIPLGGYVVLPQLDPTGMESVQEGEGQDKVPRKLPKIAVWKKITVSLAGAAGNIVFAFLLAWIVYAADRHPMGLEGAVVGGVETNTVAYAGGLRAGDIVLSANGQSVKTWNDLVQICSLDESVELRVRRADGVEAGMTLLTSTNANLFNIRMLEGVEAGSVCRVGRVRPDSMAQQAGVAMGDVIKSFNGQVVAGRGHLIDMVQGREGQPTAMTVERKGARVELTVTPARDPDDNQIRMGIEFASPTGTPLEQITQDVTGIFRLLKALVTPKQAGNAAKGIGGPVSIFTAFWLYAKFNLFLMLIGFARFLNINLAILNLLPIPVLDGGHIVFALYEGITRRAPSEKVMRFLINFFAIVLISLIVLLTFRDLKLIRKVMGMMKDAPAAGAKP
jgi:regulator of sigma E protease